MPEDNINAQPPEEFENQDKNLIKKVLVAIWNLTILSVLVGVSIYTISESIRQYDMLESYINMDTQLAPLMFAIMAPFLSWFLFEISIAKRIILLAGLLVTFITAWLHLIQYNDISIPFREDFIGGYIAALLFSLPGIITGRGFLLLFRKRTL
jgi:hypothetical protein